MIFEVVVIDDQEKRYTNADDGQGMNIKSGLCKSFPASFRSCMLEESIGSDYRRDQRCDYQEMTKVANEVVHEI